MVAQAHLGLLCSTIFLYALCFMAQAPLLPYMVDKVGANASHHVYGLLMSTFSGLQLVGSLLSGPLTDTYGGKVLLIISFASSAVCYVTTATATTVWMLFASRLATLMQHAVLAARTIVIVHSDESHRAAFLGYIGASYGLGFALGPAAGGWLSSRSLQTAAWAAAAGSCLALCIVSVGLPADDPRKHRPKLSNNNDKTSTPTAAQPFSITSLSRVVQCPGVPSLLLVQAGTGLAQSLFQGTFSLVMQQRYSLSSKANGLVLSYVGCCIVFAQAVVIKPVSQKLGEGAAVKLGCCLSMVSFLGLAVSTGVWQMLLCLMPLAIAGATVATLNVARLTKAVPTSQVGTVMALDMSMSSGLRTVSPLLGSWLFQRYGYPAVATSCAALVAAVLLHQLTHNSTIAVQNQLVPTVDGTKTKAQ